MEVVQPFRMVTGGEFPHCVEARDQHRQQITFWLSKNGVRKRDYRIDQLWQKDRYRFAKPRHAVLLRLRLTEGCMS